jgi:tetratricopeptide (TPR) repeat protein
MAMYFQNIEDYKSFTYVDIPSLLSNWYCKQIGNILPNFTVYDIHRLEKMEQKKVVQKRIESIMINNPDSPIYFPVYYKDKVKDYSIIPKGLIIRVLRKGEKPASVNLKEYIYKHRGLKKVKRFNDPLALDAMVENYLAAYNDLGRYREALEINPNFWHAHYNLGVEYLNKGLDKEAISEFKEVLRLDPTNAYAKQMLEALKQKTP